MAATGHNLPASLTSLLGRAHELAVVGFERAAELPPDRRGVEAFERFAAGAGMELLGPPPTALGGS
jgi:hypothetical protein